jgi:hypothetical protein
VFSGLTADDAVGSRPAGSAASIPRYLGHVDRGGIRQCLTHPIPTPRRDDPRPMTISMRMRGTSKAKAITTIHGTIAG